MGGGELKTTGGGVRPSIFQQVQGALSLAALTALSL